MDRPGSPGRDFVTWTCTNFETLFREGVSQVSIHLPTAVLTFYQVPVRGMRMTGWFARMYSAFVGVAKLPPEWNAQRPRPIK